MQTSALKEILNCAPSGIRPESGQSVDAGSLIQGVAPCALAGAPQFKTAGLLDRVSREAAKRLSAPYIVPQNSAQNLSKQVHDGTSRRVLETRSFGCAFRPASLGSSDFTIGCNSNRRQFLGAEKTHSTGCESLTFLNLCMPSFQRSKGLSNAGKTSLPFLFRKLSAKNKKN